MDTVNRIFALLASSGIEQKAFAADLGLAENVISTWRTGRTKSYRKYLPQIAAALDTTVEYLLTGAERSAALPENDGEPIGPNKRRVLESIDDMSEEEMLLLLARIEKIKELRI